MSIRTLALAALTAGTLTTTGCATAEGLAQHENSVANRSSLVRVANNNWSDVTVYLVRPGVRARLGSVPSMTQTDLRIPPALFGTGAQMQLVAVPLASNRPYVSQNIYIIPGQRIDLRVENSINLSSFSVW
jgi:hypothetical protein